LKGVVPGVLVILGVALVWLGAATVAQTRAVATELESTALATT
jgi:hypothetical protein